MYVYGTLLRVPSITVDTQDVIDIAPLIIIKEALFIKLFDDMSLKPICFSMCGMCIRWNMRPLMKIIATIVIFTNNLLEFRYLSGSVVISNIPEITRIIKPSQTSLLPSFMNLSSSLFIFPSRIVLKNMASLVKAPPAPMIAPNI